MSHPIDLTGQKFGRLTAIQKVEKSAAGQTRWLCSCDCGKMVICQLGALRSGHSRSCGCLRRETTIKRSKTHGHATGGVITPTYHTYQGMLARCSNPNNKHYKYYGGKGIAVCNRWLESFENFLEDMGEKPEGTSLERKDSNGSYTKENCKWATPTEQANNKSNNRIITYKGESKTLSEWAKIVGINPTSLSERIEKWGVVKALTTPKIVPIPIK